jgi:hypothetical protein
MDIKQIRVSNTLSFFKEGIMKKYNLVEYIDNNKPTFFFGVYTDTDLKALVNHTGMKIIIWAGTDINYSINDKVVPYIKQIKRMKNVHHISNSKFIRDDLLHFKIKHHVLPICGINPGNFKTIPKGKNVYIYTSATRPSIYGCYKYEKIIKMLPQFNFILATNRKNYDAAKKANKLDPRIVCYSDKKIIQLYRQCFIGLRLTDHDGISYTVLELGLCGIKCVHNGSQPNSLKYANINDIIKHILNESKKRGTMTKTTHIQTKSWLNIKDQWKKTGYYIRKNK